jgi:hypothetical protein
MGAVTTERKPMSAVSFAELDCLSGELLPGRTVLSLIGVIPGNVGSGTAHAVPGGGGHGATVAYACQAANSAATPGLVGALGLGEPAQSSLTCVPAAVVSH